MDAKFLGSQYANPIPADGVFDSDSAGLTKRELFAAMAMQGIWANSDEVLVKEWSTTDIARNAVEAADALLAELAKEQS
ncbi:hypothetical protein [Pseudoxanthomonas sp.]|uniref:hypothetical protein n=1 Tax=Pseudoxanthomonas sp. TaxID=1871049 RepID=UPI003F7FC114